MVKMENKIWAVPRNAFCWLDDGSVAIGSDDGARTKGHCVILNIVGPVI